MFNLVGVRQLDDFEEVWNDIELTMNNFVENQTVAYYRDLDRADIVVLLTNATPTMNQGYIIWDPFTQTNLHVLGMANCIDCDASKPYAIVDAPFAINHLTFAHEVSHLFGARHQWAADNTNTYAHAYKVEYDNQNYASLMYIPFVSEQNNTTRQARLSDPDYFKYGQPFGAENADNSRKVESTAVQISNFRTDQPGESIFVNISGPTNCMTGVDYTWVANAIGGSGGYAYQWKVSTNGYKYYDFSDETTDSLVKQFPPDLQIWYLKVEVESSDSKYGCATLVVHLSNYLPLPVSTTGFFSNGNLMILSEEDSPTEEIRIRTEFVVYPNPLKINSIVELFMTYDSDVFFEILDLKGNVFSSQVIHNVKQGKTIININEVPNQIGVYLFKIQTSNEVLTKKVFVY